MVSFVSAPFGVVWHPEDFTALIWQSSLAQGSDEAENAPAATLVCSDKILSMREGGVEILSYNLFHISMWPVVCRCKVCPLFPFAMFGIVGQPCSVVLDFYCTLDPGTA